MLQWLWGPMTWWKVSQHPVMGRLLHWLLRIVLDGHVRRWRHVINLQNKRSKWVKQHLSEGTAEELMGIIKDESRALINRDQCWLWHQLVSAWLTKITMSHKNTSLCSNKSNYQSNWIPWCSHKLLFGLNNPEQPFDADTKTFIVGWALLMSSY